MPQTKLPPGRPEAAVTLADLQARIARIEGRPLHGLAMPAPQPGLSPEAEPSDGHARLLGDSADGTAVLPERSGTLPVPRPRVSALTRLLRQPGLAEIHVDDTRGSGAGAGFALAMAVLLGAGAGRPALWIGAGLGFSEGGLPYLPGLAGHGLSPGALLLVRARRLEEAIWAGEEAARSAAPVLTILEVRGNPGRLGLEGTRRLHVRARDAGMPLLLLRQGGRAEATAAPLRLRVAPAPAAEVADRRADPGAAKLIGHPVFAITVEKSRDGRPYRLLLEWNPHDRRFHAPAEPHSGDLAALPVDRPDPARPAGTVVALRRAG